LIVWKFFLFFYCILNKCFVKILTLIFFYSDLFSKTFLFSNILYVLKKKSFSTFFLNLTDWLWGYMSQNQSNWLSSFHTLTCLWSRKKGLNLHRDKFFQSFFFLLKKILFDRKISNQIGGARRRGHFKRQDFYPEAWKKDESWGKKGGLDFKMISSLQFYIQPRPDLRFVKEYFFFLSLSHISCSSSSLLTEKFLIFFSQRLNNSSCLLENQNAFRFSNHSKNFFTSPSC